MPMGVGYIIAGLFAISTAAVSSLGCAGSEPAGPSFAVSFDSTPAARSAQTNAQRVELYLVDSCASVTLGDRPVPAAAGTFVLRNESGSFETVPDDGDYGLYAVAQDGSCAVVAAGCNPVSIDDSTGTLSVTLSNVQGSGCPVGQSCAIDTTGECISGTGGTGGAGGMPFTRVEAGLILLYDFDEQDGAAVADQSQVAPLHDLTISDPSNVTWGTDHLTIDAGTLLSTTGAATKVHSRATASGELTVEAWVRPADITQGGPARIISMSTSASLRNFLVAQEMSTFATRFRAEGQTGSDNGSPTVFSSTASASPQLVHLVFTHGTNGDEIIYIDGAVDTTFARVGGLSQWDASYPIVVANEADLGRDWLGELHLIAVYERALSAAEVEQNFTAGP